MSLIILLLTALLSFSSLKQFLVSLIMLSSVIYITFYVISCRIWHSYTYKRDFFLLRVCLASTFLLIIGAFYKI